MVRPPLYFIHTVYTTIGLSFSSTPFLPPFGSPKEVPFTDPRDGPRDSRKDPLVRIGLRLNLFRSLSLWVCQTSLSTRLEDTRLPARNVSSRDPCVLGPRGPRYRWCQSRITRVRGGPGTVFQVGNRGATVYSTHRT